MLKFVPLCRHSYSAAYYTINAYQSTSATGTNMNTMQIYDWKLVIITVWPYVMTYIFKQILILTNKAKPNQVFGIQYLQVESFLGTRTLTLQQITINYFLLHSVIFEKLNL